MKKKSSTIKLNYYVLLVVALLFCVFIAKLIYISYATNVDGVNIKEFAANRNTQTEVLRASRGTIYSTNNEVLAKDVNSYTIVAYLSSSRTTDDKHPHHVVDKEYTANTLSEYINTSPEKIMQYLNFKGYQTYLGPGGTNISEKKKQEIAALDLPGIDFIPSTKRYYPFGDFASYIIGYAKKNDEGRIVGELGVESYYNKELTGINGKNTYQKDAYGYQIANTPVLTEKAKSGSDIYLSIDSNVQMYLENTLEDFKEEYTYEWATVTVANAKSGAILGSASTPSFDPNILNITNYNAPLVSYTYEPGSTMKIFSYMTAIEEGIYDGSKKYLSGSKKVGENVISDWNRTGWGNITYDTGFTYSSNVAAINLGLSLGKTKLVDYYKRFGFAAKTGIEMANEYPGVLNPKSDVDLASISVGQGLTTTPIQNIQALTTLANKGTMVKPYIVEKIVDHDTQEILYEAKRVELGTPVSEQTIKKMLELMYMTVNSDDVNITGKYYKTASTTLVGKTGTAQVASSKGGYLTGDYNNIRSFAGVFPYENPEYIIYFSVKKLHGSTPAMAKVVKSVVESIAKYKNLDQLVVKEDESKLISIENYINKDTNEVIEKLKKLNVNVTIIGSGNRIINQYPTKGSTVMQENKVFLLTNSKDIYMVDLTGWSNSDVTNYCALLKLDCKIDGYGKVVTQSISEGEKLESGQTIEIGLAR